MSIFEALFKSRSLKKCEELEIKVNQLEIDLKTTNQLFKDLNSKIDIYRDNISKSINDGVERQSTTIEDVSKEIIKELSGKLEEMYELISKEMQKARTEIGEVKVVNDKIMSNIKENNLKIDKIIDDNLLEQIKENREFNLNSKVELIDKCESLSEGALRFSEEKYEELLRQFDDANRLLKLILANELVDQISVVDNKKKKESL